MNDNHLPINRDPGSLIDPKFNEDVEDMIPVNTGKVTIPSSEKEKVNVVLSKSSKISDVTHAIINQVNELQMDIRDLESMRESIKKIFPDDPNNYRNSYVIENKVKTFTGFYTTILSYKHELNGLLIKLREMLNTGGSVEEFKTALREVMAEQNVIRMNKDKEKERIAQILEERPNLMPTKM